MMSPAVAFKVLRTHLRPISVFFQTKNVQILAAALAVVFVTSTVLMFLGERRLVGFQTETRQLQAALTKAQAESRTAQDQLTSLENEDPRKTNTQLTADMAHLKATYAATVTAYNAVVAYRERTSKTSSQDSLFATILSYLAQDNEASAEASLAQLTTTLTAANAALDAATGSITVAAPASNQAPNSGFSRQNVTVNGTQFLVDIVAADLNSTRVEIDTASDSTCGNNCPVLALADYVSRSGAYAGVNGSYFCPDTYPSCAGKTNSFDTLLMNKNKVYFNSDNNVYSTVPAVIFSGNSMRLVSASEQWGRDTSVDAVIANRPMLVQGGSVAFTGTGEAKEAIRSNRGFVGATGNTGYIGVVHGVTVAESAQVLQTLGVHDAINLDSGGSTALWASGGYKDGPGRNLPNVVLFVRK